METKRKRKALTELTNTETLIPISVLRKLVESKHKPPISILKSISSSTNPNLSDIRSEACSNSSISSNSRSVKFKTPPISPGDVVSKDAGQYKMLNVEKSAKPIEADVVITRRVPAEKKKGTGKAIDAALYTPCPISAKDIENASTNLSSSKTKQKGKSNLIILDEPAQNVKRSVKGFSNPSRCSNEKPDKGKTSAVLPSGPLAFETEDMKGFEKRYSRSGSKTVSREKESCRPAGIFIRESREAGSGFLNSSKAVGDRTEDKDKVLSSFGSLVKETKDKGKAVLHSTCPPKLRHDYDSDGDGNTEPLKSLTDLPRKKRCVKEEESTELPREYIEQMNAYFKEVDSFELLEEEVSEDELD